MDATFPLSHSTTRRLQMNRRNSNMREARDSQLYTMLYSASDSTELFSRDDETGTKTESVFSSSNDNEYDDDDYEDEYDDMSREGDDWYGVVKKTLLRNTAGLLSGFEDPSMDGSTEGGEIMSDDDSRAERLSSLGGESRTETHTFTYKHESINTTTPEKVTDVAPTSPKRQQSAYLSFRRHSSETPLPQQRPTETSSSPTGLRRNYKSESLRQPIHHPISSTQPNVPKRSLLATSHSSYESKLVAPQAPRLRRSSRPLQGNSMHMEEVLISPIEYDRRSDNLPLIQPKIMVRRPAYVDTKVRRTQLGDISWDGQSGGTKQVGSRQIRTHSTAMSSSSRSTVPALADLTSPHSMATRSTLSPSRSRHSTTDTPAAPLPRKQMFCALPQNSRSPVDAEVSPYVEAEAEENEIVFHPTDKPASLPSSLWEDGSVWQIDQDNENTFLTEEQEYYQKSTRYHRRRPSQCRSRNAVPEKLRSMLQKASCSEGARRAALEQSPQLVKLLDQREPVVSPQPPTKPTTPREGPDTKSAPRKSPSNSSTLNRTGDNAKGPKAPTGILAQLDYARCGHYGRFDEDRLRAIVDLESTKPYSLSEFRLPNNAAPAFTTSGEVRGETQETMSAQLPNKGSEDVKSQEVSTSFEGQLKALGQRAVCTSIPTVDSLKPETPRVPQKNKFRTTTDKKKGHRLLRVPTEEKPIEEPALPSPTTVMDEETVLQEQEISQRFLSPIYTSNTGKVHWLTLKDADQKIVVSEDLALPQIIKGPLGTVANATLDRKSPLATGNFQEIHHPSAKNAAIFEMEKISSHDRSSAANHERTTSEGHRLNLRVRRDDRKPVSPISTSHASVDQGQADVYHDSTTSEGHCLNLQARRDYRKPVSPKNSSHACVDQGQPDVFRIMQEDIATLIRSETGWTPRIAPKSNTWSPAESKESHKNFWHQSKGKASTKIHNGKPLVSALRNGNKLSWPANFSPCNASIRRRNSRSKSRTRRVMFAEKLEEEIKDYRSQGNFGANIWQTEEIVASYALEAFGRCGQVFEGEDDVDSLTPTADFSEKRQVLTTPEDFREMFSRSDDLSEAFLSANGPSASEPLLNSRRDSAHNKTDTSEIVERIGTVGDQCDEAPMKKRLSLFRQRKNRKETVQQKIISMEKISKADYQSLESVAEERQRGCDLVEKNQREVTAMIGEKLAEKRLKSAKNKNCTESDGSSTNSSKTGKSVNATCNANRRYRLKLLNRKQSKTKKCDKKPETNGDELKDGPCKQSVKLAAKQKWKTAPRAHRLASQPKFQPSKLSVIPEEDGTIESSVHDGLKKPVEKKPRKTLNLIRSLFGRKKERVQIKDPTASSLYVRRLKEREQKHARKRSRSIEGKLREREVYAEVHHLETPSKEKKTLPPVLVVPVERRESHRSGATSLHQKNAGASEATEDSKQKDEGCFCGGGTTEQKAGAASPSGKGSFESECSHLLRAEKMLSRQLMQDLILLAKLEKQSEHLGNAGKAATALNRKALDSVVARIETTLEETKRIRRMRVRRVGGERRVEYEWPEIFACPAPCVNRRN